MRFPTRSRTAARLLLHSACALLLTAACVAQEPQPTLHPSLPPVGGESPVLVAAPHTDARPAIQFPLLRYNEDWSALRDPAQRTHPLDRIKYLPLGSTGAYLSLGGEYRAVYEFYNNQYWGQGPQDTNGWLLERAMLHADLHVNSYLRVFGQLQSAVENGRNGGARPYDKDKLDLHQAFVDLRLPAGDRGVILRAGRQEFFYGSGRLIEAREGLNTRISFDGFKAMAHAGRFQIDGFATRPTLQKQGWFDDTPDSKREFWGVYATAPVRQNTRLDLYYLGLDAKAANFNRGIARQVRQTFGGRWSGHSGPMDYDDEVIGQFGSFGNGDIRAWAVAVEHGYTFAGTRTSPRIGLRTDVASGDANPRSGTLGTFSPLFPKGKYFGEADLNGPSNTIDVIPAVSAHVTKRATLTASYGAFWRETIHDGLYGFATNLERPAGPSRARFVGQQAEFDVDYGLTTNLAVRAVYQHYFAGEFLKQTPHGRDVNYVTAWFDYHF